MTPMLSQMMWFKREPKQADKEDGVVSKLKRKKAVLLKPIRVAHDVNEREKEKRRHSDILDIRVSLERRDESDESLYESPDYPSDAISASDEGIPRLSRTPTVSKESLKLEITDEETDAAMTNKGHRKTMSLSNTLEMVRSLSDEWFDASKKDLDKNLDKKKSRESLWSEDDKDSTQSSNVKPEQNRKNSKKESKNVLTGRKSSVAEVPRARKTSKASSVSALNFLRRRKTPASTKVVETVQEDVSKDASSDTSEILKLTKVFLETEQKYAASCNHVAEDISSGTESDDGDVSPQRIGEHRRRLSRQTSRGKSKVRGKSQSLKVNTLRKSKSGTLKKGKKKGLKTPIAGRSRQPSIVDSTPQPLKRSSDACKQNLWPFTNSKCDNRREGSADDAGAATAAGQPDASADVAAKETTTDSCRRGVGRAESCRERDAPSAARRGKHRNASDPSRRAHDNDLEGGAGVAGGAAGAASGASSSSSLSSRSNDSAGLPNDNHESQSEISEEEEPLCAAWADSLPSRCAALPHALPPRERKAQELIHELIVSEGSHARWLRVLGAVFHRPLARRPALLPAAELRALFPALPALRDTHHALYSRLRATRDSAADCVVDVAAVADALLETLESAEYLSAVCRFCAGQRAALDALRERRRRHKELHQFLLARERRPACGRLQLRDLLACVWQRLTKYQLLLEGLLKTQDECTCEATRATCECGAGSVKRALAAAKRVLQAVDTAVRTHENEHRLRSIQSKLEVRLGGGEWEEARRLELARRTLRHDGELLVRHDAKRQPLTALLLDTALVLLHREGDKYVLKPIPHASQPLSPVIKWDKVLFRPNAAVRNTFFLMNINGVQMHELSANTPAEYAGWVKHIQEAPLAKLSELKPSHHHTKSNDDSGINVSRNPSDASEKSASTAPLDEFSESERETTSLEHRASLEDPNSGTLEGPGTPSLEVPTPEVLDDGKEKVAEKDGGLMEKIEDKFGMMQFEGNEIVDSGAAEQCAVSVASPPPAHLATRHLSHHEYLRRLDARIDALLAAKSSAAASCAGAPPRAAPHLAALAAADLAGDLPHDASESAAPPDTQQLLLAAHAHVEELTRLMSRALASPAPGPRRAGLCEHCATDEDDEYSVLRSDVALPAELASVAALGDRAATPSRDIHTPPLAIDVLKSQDSIASSPNVFAPIEAFSPTLAPPRGCCDDDYLEGAWGAARVARQALPALAGLRRALSELSAQAAPARALRAQRRDAADAARYHEYQTIEEISATREDELEGHDLQDHQNNGG